jgi:3',5'-cyclic AMP phosphodiesterase CpdA
MKKKHPIRKVFIILILAAIVIIPAYIIIVDYVNNLPKLKYSFSTKTTQNIVSYPDANFAVISDLHYYDNSLGTTGKAFEQTLNSDRKLIKDSADLIKFAIDNILKSGVKFVFVTGDLTKDGELINHMQVSAQLSRLTQGGIKVYVVPGNHDINNPDSVKYVGDKTEPISNVSALQFADIYKDDGFDSAIIRDTSSLSYVAEPENGLWVVALDTCRYSDNVAGSEEIVAGRLTQSEETWLEGVLKQANAKKKAVIVLEHHGLVEHWAGQNKLHSNYLVQDYKYINELLSSYNVRLAFTGHYHAQDITLANHDSNGFIYDIETGSLVTPQCPIRYCTISDNKITIKTDDILTKLHPNTDFAAKGNAFVKKSVVSLAYNTLRKYYVSEADSNYIADYVGAAFIAHYNGDENIKNRPSFDENKLNIWGRIVYSMEKYVIDGLWQDLPPADNNVTLDLSKA